MVRFSVMESSLSFSYIEFSTIPAVGLVNYIWSLGTIQSIFIWKKRTYLAVILKKGVSPPSPPVQFLSYITFIIIKIVISYATSRRVLDTTFSSMLNVNMDIYVPDVLQAFILRVNISFECGKAMENNACALAIKHLQIAGLVTDIYYLVDETKLNTIPFDYNNYIRDTISHTPFSFLWWHI